VQPQLSGLLAVGEIGADRSDRSAEAPAEAVAERRIEAHAAVPGVAGVDERGDPPALADPVGVLDGADGKPPPADDGLALGHAQALEGVAAHRLVAAGAEEEGRRYALARLGDGAAGLAAQQQVISPKGYQQRGAADHAQELPRGEAGRGAPDLDGAEVARAREH
jgi:hypothetical protein